MCLEIAKSKKLHVYTLPLTLWIQTVLMTIIVCWTITEWPLKVLLVVHGPN